jgi:hypothetical protein
VTEGIADCRPTEIAVGPSLVVRIVPHGEPTPPEVARIAIGVADPELAYALRCAIAAAIAEAAGALGLGDVRAADASGVAPVVDAAGAVDAADPAGAICGADAGDAAGEICGSHLDRPRGDANAQRSDGGLATTGDRFPGRVVLRRRVVEMAPPPDGNPVVNGRREGRDPLSCARVVAFSPAPRTGQDHGDAAPAPTVRLRSRKQLAEVASRLGGAIAIVPVTAKNARHLMALVDGIRAAGAIGVQLVWDGAAPPRAEVERHVFAVLERARATPGEPPVVVAATEVPVTALELLVAHRSRRKDDPR